MNKRDLDKSRLTPCSDLSVNDLEDWKTEKLIMLDFSNREFLIQLLDVKKNSKNCVYKCFFSNSTNSF